MGERHVELATVGVRVEVAEAGGDAAAHLPVRRRVRAHLQLAPAVAQPVEGRELVGQLARQRTAAERPDVHGVPGRRLVRHLEHGIGDVEAAAQVAVAVGALQLHVSGGLPLLDQPVLEHEGTQLRVGRPVVHDLRALRPARGRAEMRPGTRAQRHRLAHVQRPPALVAEDVDAGVVRQRGEVRALIARDRLAGLGLARATARAQQVEGIAHRHRVRAQLREQRAEDTRAREGVGQRAVHLVHLDPERAGERREGALPDERGEAACELNGAEGGRRGPVEPCALERLAQHAHVEARVVRDQHAALEQVGELAQNLLRRRRAVDHPLGDPGEALDPARERALHLHERVEGLMQLPAAHEDGTDLGHLAEVAAVPVGLGVERHELGGREGLVELGHERVIESRRPDGWGEVVHPRA